MYPERMREYDRERGSERVRDRPRNRKEIGAREGPDKCVAVLDMCNTIFNEVVLSPDPFFCKGKGSGNLRQKAWSN